MVWQEAKVWDHLRDDELKKDYAGAISKKKWFPVAMTANQTNYIYLTDTGTVTVNTTGFPAVTDIVRVATIVAGNSSITSITDSRLPYGAFGAALSGTYMPLAGGTFTGTVTFADTINVVFNTATGTQIGTGATQKIGLWGAIGIITLLPFAALPFKLVFTPTFLDLAVGGTFLVYLMQWMTGQRRRLTLIA